MAHLSDNMFLAQSLVGAKQRTNHRPRLWLRMSSSDTSFLENAHLAAGRQQLSYFRECLLDRDKDNYRVLKVLDRGLECQFNVVFE